MDQYKKRLRVLAEYLGAEMDFPFPNAFRFLKGKRSLTYTKKSRTDVECQITTPELSTKLQVRQDLMFDVVHRVFSPNHAAHIRRFRNDEPLSLDEFIAEEIAQEQVENLQARIREDWDFEHDLGGNRYLARYFRGILILCDDLCEAPTNVVSLID